MKDSDRSAAMQGYISEQYRELRQLTGEEIEPFVAASLSKLAIDYFVPMMDDVSRLIPEVPPGGLGSMLINGAHNPIVDPSSLKHALPARVSRSNEAGHNHNLFIPMEGRWLKLQTWLPDASYFPAAEGYVSMRIMGYDTATQSEAADWIEKRSYMGEHIAPDTTILLASNEAEYSKWPETKGYSITAITRDVHTRYYSDSKDKSPPEPHDFAEMHTIVMSEAQVALRAFEGL